MRVFSIWACQISVAFILMVPHVAHAGDSRSDFLKLIDRPRVPLAAEVTPLPAHGDLSEFHFTYAAEAGQRVPGILVKRTDSVGRRPVVIALHGTGGNK